MRHAFASLHSSDGSKSFLRLLPGDFHFHLVALGVSKEVTPFCLMETGWLLGSRCQGQTRE